MSAPNDANVESGKVEHGPGHVYAVDAVGELLPERIRDQCHSPIATLRAVLFIAE